MKYYQLYRKYKTKYNQVSGMNLSNNCNTHTSLKNCCLDELCNPKGRTCQLLGKSPKNKICQDFLSPPPIIPEFPNYNNILSANQFYINAHGIPPSLTFRKKERITFPLGLTPEEVQSYARTISKGELPIENFTGIVPHNTILVTATPPEHFLMFDDNEMIPLQLMDFLSKKTLLGLLLDKRELSTILSESKSKWKKYGNIDWIPSFLNNIQVYKPGDIYFNNEQVFESSEMSDVFDLNQGWNLTSKIKSEHQIDSRGQDLDEKTDDSFQPQTRLEAIKTLSIPPKFDVQELMGIESERGGVKIKSLGKRPTSMRTVSNIKEQANTHSLRSRGSELIRMEGIIYDYPYYPWSLSGIIDNIRSRVPEEEWVVIYDFVCNPSLDKADKERWGVRNFHELRRLRNDLTTVSKSNSQLLGDEYYKYTGLNINDFIYQMSVADESMGTFMKD